MCLIHLFASAPWLSWLRRPTVIHMASEDREFESLWGSFFLLLLERTELIFSRVMHLAKNQGASEAR